MESEKVKELKKWLENEDNVYYNETCYEILIYINELESENEKLKKENQLFINQQINFLKERKNVNIKDIDVCKAQKDRIAELEKENKTKTDTITDLLKKQEFYEKEKLTKFAERLFEKYSYDKLTHEPDEDIEIHLTASELDETLKECLGK